MLAVSHYTTRPKTSFNSATVAIVYRSVFNALNKDNNIPSMFLQRHISNASILFLSDFLILKPSASYRKTVTFNVVKNVLVFPHVIETKYHFFCLAIEMVCMIPLAACFFHYIVMKHYANLPCADINLNKF